MNLRLNSGAAPRIISSGELNGVRRMALTLGSNIASLQAQRQLFKTSDSLSTVFERLSSGQRINKASDDAAGLAISQSLNTDRRVFNQGIRNLSDGISVLNTADGTIGQLTEIVIRLKELAEQAANGTLGSRQREALDNEAQALKAEFNRITESTEFNGIKLFDGNLGEVRIQAGYGLDGGIQSGLGGDFGAGSFRNGVSYASSSRSTDYVEVADVNGDGMLDLVHAGRNDASQDELLVTYGNGDGTFGAHQTITTINSGNDIALSDLDNDGDLDLIQATFVFDGSLYQAIEVLTNDGGGNFTSQGVYQANTFGIANFIASGDLNKDGIDDLVTRSQDQGSGFTYSQIWLGNGDGTFSLSQSGSAEFTGSVSTLELADLNNDGALDQFYGYEGSDSSRVGVRLGNNDGTFGSRSVYGMPTSGDAGNVDAIAGDINNDGILDLVSTTSDEDGGNYAVRIGDGDGTFGTVISYAVGTGPRELQLADLDSDGTLDLLTSTSTTLSLRIGNGDGTFGAIVDSSSGVGSMIRDLKTGDFNGDGVIDIVSAAGDSDGTLGVFLTDTVDGIAPILDFSLNSRADALAAFSIFDNKLDSLTKQRGSIGAFQSRLASAFNTLSATTENYAAAESRIKDADIAFETSRLTRLNILQQAASAVLAQANQQPALALSLLS